MSHVIRLVTLFLLVLPIALAWGGLSRGGDVAAYGIAIAGAMALIYGFVFLRMRPTRFEIDGNQLRIVFPLRTLTVDLDDVSRVGPITFEIFRRHYPRPLRLGAGGLFGGFGLLMTQNGKVQFYISRDEPLVLLEFESGRMPLLISPTDPEAFARAVDQ